MNEENSKATLVSLRLVNQRLPFQRLLDVHQGIQRLVIDRYNLHRILGQVAAVGQNHRHRVAHVAHLSMGQRVLQEPQQIAVRPQPHRNGARLHHGGDIVESQHIHHTRHFPRRPGVYGQNMSVGVRAANNSGVEHVGQLEVVHELSPPGQKPPVLFPANGGADIGSRHFGPQSCNRDL